MRTLGFPLLLSMLLALAGCAMMEPPKPLSAAEVVEMAKSGKSAQEIIAELQRTWTVLPMQAANIVAMHEAGVPTEVLDYLQRAQIDEIRWRDRAWYGPAYGPAFGPSYGWGPCRYRGRFGC